MCWKLKLAGLNWIKYIACMGKPREAMDGSERPPPPRAMTVKLKGYGTKIKFIRAHRCLSGKNIYINKDLTKDTHDVLLKIKKDCVEGVAVYIVDGCVLIWPCSIANSRKVYRIVKSDDLKCYGLNKTSPNTVQF